MRDPDLDALGAEPNRTRSWRSFLDLYADTVLRAAGRAARDPEEGRNVGAEVLKRLAERWPGLLDGYRSASGRAGFSTWLAVVARNHAIDVLRSWHGRGRLEARVVSLGGGDAGDPPAPVRSGPEAVAGERSAGRELAKILAELAGDERALVRLYFLEGTTTEELRRSFGGQTRSQVYNRVHAVMEKLRQRTSRVGLGPEDLEALRDFDWDASLGDEGGGA